MKPLRHLAAAAGGLFLLSACQSTGEGLMPGPAALSLAQGMHPTIKSAFERDYIGVIVKGTSAEAMARACPRDVRVVPQYRASLNAVLQTNDLEFRPGTSRREVARKIAEHREERDCALLAARLNSGGYDNIFLERI